ncbi:hypothetical protein AWENTII_005262 [Aspergillus wentii]
MEANLQGESTDTLIARSERTPDAESLRSSGKSHVSQKGRFDGWRSTLLLASLAGVIVLAFNLSFTIWAAVRHNVKDDRGILFDGDCDRVKWTNVGIHLLINTLSTTLLSASNYCMQCLCAPTRRNIDNAHSKAQWLDIGVPSTHNLLLISKKRSCLWICLALTSLPLHLVYNSTIFSTQSANDYNIYVGTGSLGNTSILNPGWFENSTELAFDRLKDETQDGSLTRLDAIDCVNVYSTTFQIEWGGVVLVTNNDSMANNYTWLDTQYVFSPRQYQRALRPDQDPYRWLCPEYSKPGVDCNVYLPDIEADAKAGNWTVDGHLVDHCLVEKSPTHCKLQYSLPLAIVVIVFNAIKAILMCYIAFSTEEQPILTTGDAVASFIREPDVFSKDMSCTGRSLVVDFEWHRKPKGPDDTDYVFRSRKRRWASAVSTRRWGFGISFYVLSMVICIGLLLYGFSQMRNTRGIWSLGFEAIDARTLIHGNFWPNTMIKNTMIANIPQLVYSMLYFCLNAIFTTMTLAAEWSQYAIQRKGLRVSSSPEGAQRSSYFLSLPYRYAIPMILLSILLHWLISQSLFLVGIDAYTAEHGRAPDRDVITCAYSPVAIVCALSIGTLMVACLVGLGFKRFKSGMPVAGSCSQAIAAACHPNLSLDEKNAIPTECIPMQWGVVSSDGPFKHCSFTTGNVEEPVDGETYR